MGEQGRFSYDHPVDRYCGNQMCCWGPAGKKTPNMTKRPDEGSAKCMKWSAVRAARKARHDQLYRIHEAERRVIEAAKAWFHSPEKDGATADELALAIARLQEAEHA